MLSAVAALVAVDAASISAAEISVTLRQQAVPHGSVVRLGDVAEIATADRQQELQLGALPLMPAPARGTERFLRMREIQDMLAAQGVEVGEMKFSGAEQVAVALADARTISDSNVKQTALQKKPMNWHAAILAGRSVEGPATKLDDERAKTLRQGLAAIIAKYVSVKTGKADAWKVDCDVSDHELARLNAATASPSCVGGSEPFTGRQRFVLSFPTPDGPVQLAVLAEVSPPPMPAVVAVRPITRGDVVTAIDVELRMLDANSKPAGQRVAIDKVDSVIGKEARQSIQVGDVLLTDSIQSPILVKRGDVITVTSESGGIRVRTTAKALHEGSRGDLIQVESLMKSHERFDVRVVGTREAAVFAMPRPAAPEPDKRIETAKREMNPESMQRR